MQHVQFQSAAGQLSHRSNAQILPTHEEVDERRITESPGGRDDPAEPSVRGSWICCRSQSSYTKLLSNLNVDNSVVTVATTRVKYQHKSPIFDP